MISFLWVRQLRRVPFGASRTRESSSAGGARSIAAITHCSLRSEDTRCLVSSPALLQSTKRIFTPPSVKNKGCNSEIYVGVYPMNWGGLGEGESATL
jgi:hypothetical protein